MGLFITILFVISIIFLLTVTIVVSVEDGFTLFIDFKFNYYRILQYYGLFAKDLEYAMFYKNVVMPSRLKRDRKRAMSKIIKRAVEESCEAIARNKDSFTLYLGNDIRACYGSDYAVEVNKVLEPYGYKIVELSKIYTSVEVVRSNEI